MRILHIITLCELGGAQAVVINIANNLCQHHDVIVAVGEGDGKMLEMLDPSVKVERIPTLVRKLSPVKELNTLWTMRKLYKKYLPDIIHLHSSKAGALGRLIFPSKKIVYTVHGFDSIRLAYRKFLPLERLLQKRCAAIVGVSKYDELHLISEGITNNVTTIYNGLSRPERLGKNPYKKMSGDYKGTVLCIARLSPQKNHGLFIKVAAQYPDYRFVWIGNQTLPDFKYPDNVYFIGNIPNAGAYTEYADVFMLPSNYEGLPMVIIEALSNGTPVVASAVGGIPEILDGTNGIAVENDDKIMAKALGRFLNASPNEKKKISEAAMRTYSEGFSALKMVDGYMTLYKKIYDNNTACSDV